MARYKLIIADAQLAHDKEIERNTNTQVARDIKAKRESGEKVNEFDVANLTRGHRRHFADKFKQRPVGAVHGVSATECPFEMPNCRNCGDPQHAASCQAQGHCPDCGTKHGIAPDSVLAANGYALVAMTPEEEAAEAAAAAQSDADRQAADEDAAIRLLVERGRLTQQQADAIGRRNA
jgi:hypothetical protein